MLVAMRDDPTQSELEFVAREQCVDRFRRTDHESFVSVRVKQALDLVRFLRQLLVKSGADTTLS